MLILMVEAFSALAAERTSLRRAAGAADTAALSRLVDQLCLAAGHTEQVSALIDRDVDESGRSALHHACWRGALANVELLLDLGCDLDQWSTGLHSFGKSPIFYAITRDRDEVVELLLARGAKTRVLNNKGQSVLSLAASHLSPRVVDEIARVELAEEGELPARWRERLQRCAESERPLVRDGGWLDFWASHPDGQTYGDLDPRFYTARATDVLDDRRLAVNPTTREGRRRHKHMPGDRSRAWWPPRRQAGSDADAGGDADVDSEAHPATAAAAATPRARGEGVTPQEVLSTAVEMAAAPVVALLSAEEEEEERGAPPPPPTALELAVAVDAAVAALSAHKGAWLKDAARRVGRAPGASPALLREAAALQVEAADDAAAADTNDAAADADDGTNAAAPQLCSDPTIAKMRRRLLLAAVSMPSEAAEAEAAAAATAAIVAAAARREERKVAAAAAEKRRAQRLQRVDELPDAPPPAEVRWVDSLESLQAMAAAMEGADRVGIDTEWTDGPLGPSSSRARWSVSDAVLATVQLAVGRGASERSFVCDARLQSPPGAVASSGADADADAATADDVEEEGAAAAARLEYHVALAALLRRVLLRGGDGPTTPAPIGFAFTADAQKLATWLVAVQEARVGDGRGDGGGCGGGDGGGDSGSADRLAAQIRSMAIDVQQMAADAGLGSRAVVPSLRATCAHWLGDRMSKEEQQSDWAARPLSAEQMRYAALDASMCLRVLDAMETDSVGGSLTPLSTDGEERTL